MAQLPEPEGLTHCKVTGNFAAFVADGVDANDFPDWEAMDGTAVIMPNILFGKDMNPLRKRTFFPDQIICDIDEDGDLSRNGEKYVMLLAGGDTITPVGFNYRITFSLTPPDSNTPVLYGPFSFDVIPGGEVDLADATPVASFEGEPMLQGLQGFPGDMALSYSNAAYGTISLTDQYVPSTLNYTLTGNLVLNAPEMSPLVSGTITLVFTQDATGGRTVTWPAGTKWPDGIAQQPSAGPNTTSMINLFWTGNVWLGMIGGKGFA